MRQVRLQIADVGIAEWAAVLDEPCNLTRSTAMTFRVIPFETGGA